MFLLVVAFLAVSAGTTWLALEPAATRSPALGRRLAGAGLVACLVTGIVLIVAAVASA